MRWWPFAVGAVLGALLAWYTDAPWLTVLVIALLALTVVRRLRRRPPPA